MVVFGIAPHILRMAYQAARRGILNQHLLSEWLSLLVKTRSSQAVRKLLDLQPDTARVVDDGVERDTPIAGVSAGDLVRVRPGERIPVDGEVREGHSTVDLSLVTGEPVPVESGPGGAVIGGSINGAGSLLVVATRVGTESFLAQVVRHVEDARALKPGILHLVDRVLRVHTPTVLVVSALALTGWLLGSLFAALGVLVMGYPCAVGIAAPLAVVRAAGEAADQGIITRTGAAFQTFGQIATVLLDKTGTRTEGRPAVREIEALGSEEELLRLAAAAESSSEHPLARAVVDFAQHRGLAVPTAQEFTSVTGLGVIARVEGRQVLVGRPRFLADRDVDLGPLPEAVARWEGSGRTVVGVAVDDRPLGVIALGDEIRADAVEAAAHIAGRLGIDDVRAGVLPEGKAQIMREFQDGGARVAMVGDGRGDRDGWWHRHRRGVRGRHHRARRPARRAHRSADVALGLPAHRAERRAGVPVQRRRHPAGDDRAGPPGVGDGRRVRLGHHHLHQLHRRTPVTAVRRDQQCRPQAARGRRGRSRARTDLRLRTHPPEDPPTIRTRTDGVLPDPGPRRHRSTSPSVLAGRVSESPPKPGARSAGSGESGSALGPPSGGSGCGIPGVFGAMRSVLVPGGTGF